MYDGLIFDKDGVLLDSGLDNFRWKDRTRVKKAREQGIDLTIEDSKKLISSKGVEEAEKILNNKGISWSELVAIEKSVQKTKIEMINQGVIWLFPEAKKVLNEINKSKALATNAPRKVTEFTLNNFSLHEEFTSVKSNEISDIKGYYRRKKPNPKMLEEIMKENGFENPLMIGDTSADILAAENAGIDSAHVQSYSNNKHPRATYSIRSLSEIKHVLKN